jgi:hypothetical protein
MIFAVSFKIIIRRAVGNEPVVRINNKKKHFTRYSMYCIMGVEKNFICVIQFLICMYY